MADYRDELRAAHDRIEQLEREKQPARATSRRVPAVVWVLVSIALGMVLLIGLARVVVSRMSRPVRPSQPVVDAFPLDSSAPDFTIPIGLQWYPQRGVSPIFADLDTPADGKNEIIGLAWDASHDEAPLYVVALDRDTRWLRWSAGPYPAHWQSDRVHLVRLGNRLAVTDARERIHLLDIRTGKETRAAIALEREIDQACPMPDGSARLLVNEGYGQTPPSVVDLETGTVAPLGKADGKPVCSGSHDDGALPGDAAVDRAVNRRKSYEKFWSSEVLTAGDHRVAIGYIPTAMQNRYAAGFDPTSKKVLWASPLAPETASIDKHPGASFLTKLDEDQLYTVYETSAEPMEYRLVARDVATGELRYDAGLQGTAEGSYLSSVAVDGANVFVVVNSSLFAFDRSTGAPTFRLASFSLIVK